MCRRSITRCAFLLPIVPLFVIACDSDDGSEDPSADGSGGTVSGAGGASGSSSGSNGGTSSSSGGKGGGSSSSSGSTGTGGSAASSGGKGGSSYGGSVNSSGGEDSSGSGGTGVIGPPPSPTEDGTSIYAVECEGESSVCNYPEAACLGIYLFEGGVGYACSNQCNDVSDCSDAPSGGEAEAGCVQFTNAKRCVLVCYDNGAEYECPDGMGCYQYPNSPIGYCLYL